MEPTEIIDLDDITTRSEIEAQQIERLPSIATRVLLSIRPKEALRKAALDDAMELSAADVMESGREFSEVPDKERRDILTANFAHCLDRNLRYMKALEGRN